MTLLPLARVRERIEREEATSESPRDVFDALMLACECAAKLMVVQVIACVQDDPDRHRYRLHHKLVRADGIGDWDAVLKETLVGPAAQFLAPSARAELVELTQRLGPGSWQHTVVEQAWRAAAAVHVELPELSHKEALSKWIGIFASIRNKTRGHGAPLTRTLEQANPHLKAVFNVLEQNLAPQQNLWASLGSGSLPSA